MSIRWDSKEARDAFDGVRRDIKRFVDKVGDALERGEKPCTETPDGLHVWTHRVSWLPGHGWYECTKCKGEKKS